MHITIIADTIDNQSAGIHTYTAKLIENLEKIDKKNRYSYIHLEKNSFFRGKKHYIVPDKKIPLYGTYRKFIAIPKLLKKLQPDIVIEPCHIGPFRTPKNCKKVTVIHDMTPILLPKLHEFRSALVHKFLLKKIVKNADLILTPSENTKKDLQNFTKHKTKISVIALGTDFPQKEIKTAKTEDPYLLYLGTIEPRKNLGTLITTFLELKKEHNIPHKLVLAGKIGWKSTNIVKVAKKSADIILKGFVNESEKSRLYSNANIFIYPSLYEGFGLPPLEAMSYGTPVICSNGGSLKEIFAKHALTFAPNDKEQLKKLILKLLKNKKKAQEISIAGQKFAKTFTWQKTAEKTLKELEKLSR